MATPKKAPARSAAPKAAAAPAKASGPSQDRLLLAALAVADGGATDIPFAAYGEVMARQADLESVTVENIPGVGVRVTVYWAGELDDATEDVKVAEEAVTSAYRPPVTGAKDSEHFRPNNSWTSDPDSDQDEEKVPAPASAFEKVPAPASAFG